MSIFDIFRRKPAEVETEQIIKALPAPTSVAPVPEAIQVSPIDIANAYIMDDAATGAETNRGLDYEQLRAMSRVDYIAAIIQTRVNQVAEFARPSRSGEDIGFRVQLKDKEATPNKSQRDLINKVYDFILTCGDSRLDFEATFESFLRMLVRDSLTFDQACFEIVRTRGGGVAGFQIVDASTIRRSKMTSKEREQGRRDPDGIHYVQLVKHKVKAQWKAKDLCFGIRRPRSDIRYKGYGYPELEEAIPTLTALLNAEVFNAANFTNGISVSGIVAVKTKMNPQLFRAFRREFYAMLSGSHNAKKTPLIQLDPDGNEDLKALNLGSSNREMEFQEWINYNLKKVSALFQIDPQEIGFNFGQVGVTSTLNQRDSSTDVILSKERGLRPLLRAIESWLNKYVVNEIDPGLELVFTGLDVVPVDKQLELDTSKVKAFMTVDEIRATYDLDPLPDALGEVILDSVFMQNKQAAQGDQEDGDQEDGDQEDGDTVFSVNLGDDDDD